MAEKIVVDTNILIDVFERGNERLLLKLLEFDVFVPSVALYEYLWGYLYIGRDHLREKELIEKIFTVVYPDQRITLKAMELDVQLRKQGFSIPQADVLIAATALALDALLLSKDLGHYEKLRSFGLKILTEL